MPGRSLLRLEEKHIVLHLELNIDLNDKIKGRYEVYVVAPSRCFYIVCLILYIIGLNLTLCRLWSFSDTVWCVALNNLYAWVCQISY